MKIRRTDWSAVIKLKSRGGILGFFVGVVVSGGPRTGCQRVPCPGSRIWSENDRGSELKNDCNRGGGTVCYWLPDRLKLPFD